jgi:hypothetical protein
MTERPKMNQRLSAIKQQAHLYALDQEWYVDSFEQRFAELIVKECIGVVEGGSFLHDQAPTAIFARECSGAIKRHFGVEL